MKATKNTLRIQRHKRSRAKLSGIASRPRVVVYRSLLHTYVQAIDDENNNVLYGVSDKVLKAKGTKVERAKIVGEAMGKYLKEKKIDSICFDRNGYKYHGRVQVLADAIRSADIKF
jgi:large subunit ribosomal protein L18